MLTAWGWHRICSSLPSPSHLSIESSKSIVMDNDVGSLEVKINHTWKPYNIKYESFFRVIYTIFPTTVIQGHALSSNLLLQFNHMTTTRPLNIKQSKYIKSMRKTEMLPLALRHEHSDLKWKTEKHQLQTHLRPADKATDYDGNVLLVILTLNMVKILANPNTPL